MRSRTLGIMVVVFGMLVVGCSGDVAGSDEYQALEQGLAAAQAQVGDLTADLAELEAAATAATTRYEKAKATQETAKAIMADPSAFGSEDEVLDLMDDLAAPGTVMGDAAFGPAPYRAAWRGTLFGRVDATIRTWTSWLSDDGSVGGSLWTWSGTASNGEPFDLQGLELSRYDEDGLYSSIMVSYPYEDAEVMRIFREGN